MLFAIVVRVWLQKVSWPRSILLRPNRGRLAMDQIVGFSIYHFITKRPPRRTPKLEYKPAKRLAQEESAVQGWSL